jgi:HAD superfamily hydrolase (TIGR01549 family)
MLVALRAMGLHLGIVTGKSRGAWEITVRSTDLGEFDATVTDEDVVEAKPHPEGLVLALDLLGVSAAEAVYVGDSVGDARAARAALSGLQAERLDRDAGRRHGGPGAVRLCGL